MQDDAQIHNETGARFNEILGTIREGILILGEDMCVKASNEAAVNAFSDGVTSIENSRLSELIRDFDLHTAFKKAIYKRKSSEVKIEILGFQRRIYDVRISPFRLKSENAAIGVFYEVTRLENLERVRQEFLSNISHELRTPLTSILAFVETLEDGAIDDLENNRRFLRVIRKNAERMQLLIDDFSELSTIEAGGVSVDAKPLNLFSLIEDISQSLSASAGSREIVIVNEVPDMVTVTADAVRLQQMLTNLIDNAIKFNSIGGKVTISHRPDEGFDRICVADTGEGISREHQMRIFERFYRVDKARSREVGGTGLGLAIVKHLARLHGGEVSVSSVAGEGTVFCVTLPQTHIE